MVHLSECRHIISICWFIVWNLDCFGIICYKKLFVIPPFHIPFIFTTNLHVLVIGCPGVWRQDQRLSNIYPSMEITEKAGRHVFCFTSKPLSVCKKNITFTVKEKGLNKMLQDIVKATIPSTVNELCLCCIFTMSTVCTDVSKKNRHWK